MNVSIRKLTKEDAEAYWEMRLEALKRHPEAFATSYEEAMKRSNPIERVQANLENENSVTIGAFIEQQLVGNVTMTFETLTKMCHRANLVGMYVDPTQRGKKLGKQLVEAGIQAAKERPSVEQINLSVVAANTGARRFYEHCGFEPFGLERRALLVNGKYYDEVHMVCFLNKLSQRK